MTDPTDAPTPTSTEVIRAPARDQVLVPLDLEQTKAAMHTYQQGLQSLLDPSDWQDAGKGERFVKKSGWRKVATWFSLDLYRVHEEVERGEDGAVLRASFTAAAVAPNGRRVEATAHCAAAESRFSGPRGNTSKLENDLRNTAETRAKNRAISDLVGMGAVSAEEAQAGAAPAAAAAGPEWGPEASEKAQETLVKALAFLLDTGSGPDATRGIALFNELGARYGYIPRAVAQAVALTAMHLKAAANGEPAPTPSAPAAPAAEQPKRDDVKVTGESDIPNDAGPNPDAGAEAEVLTGEVVEPTPNPGQETMAGAGVGTGGGHSDYEVDA